MSAMRIDASLRGKIQHLANEHDFTSQEVPYMHLFKYLRTRLA